MNHKFIVDALGVAVVIGCVVYFMKKHNTDKPDDDVVRSGDDEVVRSGDEVVRKESEKENNISTYTITEDSEKESDINAVKNDALNSIKERHIVAKEIIKDSVQSIFSSDDIKEARCEEAKKKMLEDLENL